MRFVDNTDGTVDVTITVDKDEADRFLARLAEAWYTLQVGRLPVEEPAVEPIETAPTEPPPDGEVVPTIVGTLAIDADGYVTPIVVEPPTGGVLSVLSAVDSTWRTCLEIAKRCGSNGKTVGLELKYLVKSGDVEAQGSNRGKRYRLVDDSTAEVAAG
jgi:hypothetical protein